MARTLDVRVLRFQNQPSSEEPAMLTRDLLLAGRWDDARVVFEAAIERDPTDADLLQTGGELFMERGDFVWAKRLLVLAAKRSEGWASPWLALARVLLATRDFERAEAVLERCWELAPDAPETWALDERLSTESSLERRMRAFLANPSFDDPAMLANALIAAGREEAALHVLNRGLEAVPEDVDALFVRARLHEVRGELGKARSDLARATGTDGSWATAWEALEDVCRQTGDHDAARRAESSARDIRERDAQLAELDHALLLGAAEILATDFQTLAEPPPGSERFDAERFDAAAFAPVPSPPSVALELPSIEVGTDMATETANDAAITLATDAELDDLFPTYSQVHQSLPLPVPVAADTLCDAGDMEVTFSPDTLIGHPAPEPMPQPLTPTAEPHRGLRGASAGRKPYVPPSPGELRPSLAPAADDTPIDTPKRRPGRSWAR